MAAPTPTVMPARRDPNPAGPGEVLFIDTATGLTGVVRQRRGDGVYVFHPTTPAAPAQLVEEPGRFRALRAVQTDHDGHHGQTNQRQGESDTAG
jgi:hypothetical protein